MDMPREVSAGGVVFDDGRVALLQRLTGEWVMPKGHVEKGETQEQAALREVEEETGLVARILTRLGETQYTFFFPDSQEHRDKIVHWFLMTVEGGSLQPEKTFRDAALVPPGQALSMLTYENDRRMLRRAMMVRQGE